MSNNKNIIVGIDLSKSSLEVLKKAFQIAKEKNAKLTIVHAIDKNLFEKYFSSTNNKKLIKKAKGSIEQKIQELKDNGVKYTIIVEISSPSKLLMNTANDIKTALIIIGVNGEDNFKTKIFGSTSIKTIQNSSLPVLIIKNNCTNEYNNILAFTDLSKVSAKSIAFAQNFFENSNVKAIYAYKQLTDLVLTFYNSLEEKEKIKKGVVTDSKKKFDKFIKENNIKNKELLEVYHGLNDALLQKANEEQSDLIVMGSNGVKNADSFMYGSIALYMIENVQSDILVYVPKGN